MRRRQETEVGQLPTHKKKKLNLFQKRKNKITLLPSTRLPHHLIAAFAICRQLSSPLTSHFLYKPLFSICPFSNSLPATATATESMADALFRSVYHGCIAGCDAEIDRRPYHKNCGCALHDRDNRRCSRAMSKHNTVSYPIRRAWSEGSLATVAAAVSGSGSGMSSPSSSPSMEVESLGSNRR